MKYGAKWPTYADQWDRMAINPSRVAEFERVAKAHLEPSAKARYRELSKQTGVPWFMIAVMAHREYGLDNDGDARFDRSLAQGDPWNRVSTNEPSGRGPFKSWEEAGVDALVTLKHLDRVIDWRLEKILYYCEIFNGLGYENRGLPSPYIWGGTNVQERGKFVRDHVFDPTVMDTQLGCAPILKTLAKFDPSIKFVRETPMGVEPEEEPEVSEIQELRTLIEGLAKQVKTLAQIVSEIVPQAPAAPKPLPMEVVVDKSQPPDAGTARATDLRTGILSALAAIIGPATGTLEPATNGTIGGLMPLIGVGLSALGVPSAILPLLGRLAKRMFAGP